MTLLSSFKAVHYRGIDGLSLPRLTRANLVTGVNGIGKTALLEAMWLFMKRHNPVLLWDANVQRSDEPVLDPVARLGGLLKLPPRRGLLPRRRTGVAGLPRVLELHGVENGSHHELRSTFEKVAEIARPANARDDQKANMWERPIIGRLHTYLDGKLVEGKIDGLYSTPLGFVRHENPEPPVPRPNFLIEGTKFQLETSHEYLQRYSGMVRESRKEDFTNAINLMLPKVEGVEILIDEAGKSYLSALTSDGVQLPFSDLGGGVVRLSRLLLSCFASRDGMLLVDEMENGMHHSMLGDIWTSARRWMHEWNVQIVATTHSAECIDAAMTAFEDAPEGLSIHKLFANEETEQIEATTFSGESLEGARNLDLEVR